MVRCRPHYDVHPTVAYAQSILANLPATTGSTLDQWVRRLERDGPAGDAERRAWLTSEHGIGATTAWLIIDHAAGRGAAETDPAAYLEAAPGYVDAMYAGPKAALRPVHDTLETAVRALGADVRICPCRTIVPVYRTHVIAQIRPKTRTRIDLGLALKGVRLRIPGRIRPTGGLERGDRITHRVAITRPEDVDALVAEWLAHARDLDR